MKIALVGSPNVGKSVIFHHLTGQYVTVSNYPGTTVEVTRGQFKWGDIDTQVIDTPGIYSLTPISGEEQVTRDLLISETPDLILHVIDAKNMERMLPITLQLLETGLDIILVINMMDEANRRGIKIDTSRLKKQLNIPVIPTISIKGEGIEELKRTITNFLVKIEDNQPHLKEFKINYPAKLKMDLKKIIAKLKSDYPISKESIALFILQGDSKILDFLEEDQSTIDWLRELLSKRSESNYSYQITITRKRKGEAILKESFDTSKTKKPRLQTYLSKVCTRPFTGIPILLIILYFGIYRFVGGFGAGYLVDLLENLFTRWLNPIFNLWFETLIPSDTFRSLFVGEYGIFTLGVRYAVAIILPIVGTFFFMFSILEDSGYFPRLALLVDRIFKFFGLNGRAVIPMVLGLGCDTMATLTTRILESKRERVIATFLLALAVPCSAQLGVITALLSRVSYGLFIWMIVVVGILFVVGYLTNRVLPGEETGFYMEVPLLRWPRLGNILTKTRARMRWYFIEILPVFIYSSLLIWLGRITGVFQKLLALLNPVMGWLGLPDEASVTFLFGFFRRDYGAAGLFDLYNSGLLSNDGLIVASITLTLFVPCVAQLAVTIKEHGLKVGLLIMSFIFPFAFVIGYLVHLVLALF